MGRLGEGGKIEPPHLGGGGEHHLNTFHWCDDMLRGVLGTATIEVVIDNVVRKCVTYSSLTERTT